MSRCNAFLADANVACRTPREHKTTGSVENVFLHAEQLLPAMRKALDAGFFLEDVCGVDAIEGFAIVYHLDHWEKPGRLALCVVVPHDKPEVPSIASIYPGANWHERETFDMYGIIFTGHPDLKPLLLPEAETIRPLLKEPADRVSLYHLFADYGINDCRPEFLKGIEPPAEEGGKQKKA